MGAWSISHYANYVGLLDHSNNRSSHVGIIPKGGGIGILIAFVISTIFAKISPAFWIPAVILSLISLIGDKREVSPKLRLPIQFLLTLSFIIFAPVLSDVLPSEALKLSPVFSILIFIFFILFIVATTNWYNFMDGINGIAGITAIVAFGLLAFYNYISHGDSKLTFLAVSIALACIGFLPFNFPNAKVFMGDVGSILLGFVFASFVVMLSRSFLDFICLAGFLFPFYADEFVTMFVRLKAGENLLKAHRRHFYQILVNEMGIAHWKISVGYSALQLIVGLCILLIKPFGIIPVFGLLLFFFAGFVFANYFIRMRC
ncbi:MAG: UDP-N-acetylmuramyl pentapeptide phosphotransferase [Desulfatiglans sp.]|nr:UDP-N-acetylmuramyl pentapeptide phosphotransferase [Desulfatiglans sp.]